MIQRRTKPSFSKDDVSNPMTKGSRGRKSKGRCFALAKMKVTNKRTLLHRSASMSMPGKEAVEFPLFRNNISEDLNVFWHPGHAKRHGLRGLHGDITDLQ